MLTNISIANFRGFEEEISVRIRPITILIGRNNAGKSSLIKFLQMLRQTLESQRDEFFVTDGRYVQLGNWTNLRNSRCQRQTFEFSVDIETSDIPGAEVWQLWKNASERGVITEAGDQIRLSLDLTKSPVARVSPVAEFKIRGQVRYTILKFWMDTDIRHQVELDPTDILMQQIRRVIHEIDEHADRAFVYVVCRKSSILVTNDHTHILGRRNVLLKRTKRERGQNTDIQCSNDAFRNLHGTGESA